MSLATRCPACGTIFRVVQDQLKVSEGWVRCGQCHEVFHGIEALFDLDSDPTIAARRAASRQPVAAPPPTRVFAQQRANAPIPPIPSAPAPTPPAPAVFAPRPAAPPQAAPAPQSVPATPSVFGNAVPPAPAQAPIRPGFSGFTPATRPMPPAPERPATPAPVVSPAPAPVMASPPAPLPSAPEMRPPVAVPMTSPVPQVATRTTIAPRFAARLAEEAARAQAATAAAANPPAPAIVVTPPLATTRSMPLSPPSTPLPSAPVPLSPTPAPVAAVSPPITFTPPPAQRPPATSPAPAPSYKTTAPAPLFKPTVPAMMATPSAPAPFAEPSAPIPITTPEEFDLGPLDDESEAVHGTYAPTAPMSLDSLTELAALEPLKPPPRPSAPVPFGAPSAPVPFGGRASAPVPLGTPSAPAPFDFARRAEEAASRWQTQPVPLQPRGLAAPPPAQTPASWFAPPPAQGASVAPAAPVAPVAPQRAPAPQAGPAPAPQAAPAAWFAPPPAPVATPAPAPVVEPPPAPVVESAPAPVVQVQAPAVPDAPAPLPAAPAEPIFIPPSLLARRPASEPPAPAPAPDAKAAPELPLVTPIVEPVPEPAPASGPSAVDRAADLAAAPPTSTPAPDSALSEPDSIIIDGLGAVSDFEVIEPAPEVGGTTIPSRLADDIEEELRAGPPTLASMLPEDAGEWPPKKTRKRKDKDAAAGTPESELVDKTKDPRFLREARSGARWRRPWVRATLGLTLAVLVVAAVAQVAWPLRDTIAARWPVTQPAWAWICQQADCKIEAPRAITSLALDGSSLTRTDTEHVLLFSADLHNRADHEVLMPSFDVSFMDLNGAIVARKVLSPEQLGIHQESLPALGELHVHARLQVGSLPASGFQADLFYP